MPTTFLLLRDNKQTGPHTLNALVELHLKAHDLVWVEGHSAGWRYPAEIDLLKPYVSLQESILTPDINHAEAKAISPVNKNQSATIVKNASHIYVSLPAGTTSFPLREVEVVAPDLEAKAEALLKRAQAYMAGQQPDDTETHYSRSLSDMKESYGSWLVLQKQKKRDGKRRKKILLGTLFLLVITTTSFSIRSWLNHRNGPGNSASTVVPKQVLSSTIQQKTPTTISESKHPANKLADSATTLPVLPEKLPSARQERTNTTKNKKHTVTATTIKKLLTDSTATITVESTKPVESISPVVAAKPNIPLSRLVLVSTNFVGETIAKSNQIFLKNNSTETFKSVSVIVSYFRKNEKQLGSQVVYFYNVAPGAQSVLNTEVARRATSARLQLGTITRADGSLYLIH